MDEPISLALSGHATRFPLAPDAYRLLRGYLDDTRAVLRADPDGDEIVRDLETAIGDRLAALGATPAAPVDVRQMSAVLTEVGPVTLAGPGQPGSGTPRGRFWCRIREGQWFGGICQGVSAYGQFRVDWVRTVVLLLTLLTGGLLGVAYLVLLLVLPVVPTVAEYERLRDGPRVATQG